MTNPASGLTLIGRDRHTRSVPVDATHRGVEQDACAELGAPPGDGPVEWRR